MWMVESLVTRLRPGILLARVPVLPDRGSALVEDFQEAALHADLKVHHHGCGS